MLNRLLAVLGFELLDQFLDLFRLFARGDQNRIGRRNNDDILKPDGLFRLLWNTTVPVDAFPLASWSRMSQTALQLPTSDQPQSIGNTAARLVRSMTA
jgi:hypothetical protein